MTKLCSIEGCDRLHAAKGYCIGHYMRNRKYGHPQKNVPLPARASDDEPQTEGQANPLPMELPAADSGQPSIPSQEPTIEYPFPDLKDDDPRNSDKFIANACVAALAGEKDLSDVDRRSLEHMLEKHTAFANAPEGYYPEKYAYLSNPIHELTADERFHCIRNLPEPIVRKLFPHL